MTSLYYIFYVGVHMSNKIMSDNAFIHKNKPEPLHLMFETFAWKDLSLAAFNH